MFSSPQFSSSPNPKKRGKASAPSIRIPLSVPQLSAAEQDAVMACLQSGWISTASPQVRAFESAFAETVQAEYAVATHAGTAAIHLALLGLGIGPSDEVIVPALSFVASVNPVLYVGATPVFIDVEMNTFGLDPDQLEAAITPNTKAIIVAHLYGFTARMHEIMEIAKRHEIPVIEDAAESLGATYNGQPVGTIGTFGCFSFNGNKTLTCGGGGMLVTNSPMLAEKVRHLSTQAREAGLEFSHDDIGYNMRMTGMQAALGLAQLGRLEEFLSKKRAIAETYADRFSLMPGIKPCFSQRTMPRAVPSYWLSVMLLEDASFRTMLIEKGLQSGIEMRPFFKPFHLMKPYQPYCVGKEFPVAESLWNRGVCLPSSPSLTDFEQHEVTSFIWKCLGKRRGSLAFFDLALPGLLGL